MQSYIVGLFTHYDYGRELNIIHYNSEEPPKYDLTNVVVPVYLYYSRNDWLAHEDDVLHLCNRLSNCKETMLVDNGTYSHMDYLFAVDAPTVVYNSVLAYMKG